MIALDELNRDLTQPADGQSAWHGCTTGPQWHRDPGALSVTKMQRITELMQADFSRKLPAWRLAEECGLSVRQFSRAFRKATGLSPHQYFLRVRLRCAHAFLLNPLWRLNEVALACGFSDQSHFTRAFTAVEGMSPGEWRRCRVGVGAS